MAEAKKEKVSYGKTLVKGIISENPVFVSLLGMCSTLATTVCLEEAIGMGLLFFIVMICCNVLISLLRHIIPAEVKIPAYIVIIATFVTIVKMLTQAFLPELYESLGVFISLIVVNCIILGRAEAFASKNGPLASLFDAIGVGLGFTMALCIMGIIREIIGTGALTFGEYFTFLKQADGTNTVLRIIPQDYAISLFTQPTGGFLTLGFILAFIAWRHNKKEEKKRLAEKARIEELKRLHAEKLAQKKAQEALEAKQKAEAEAEKTLVKEAA